MTREQQYQISDLRAQNDEMRRLLIKSGHFNSTGYKWERNVFNDEEAHSQLRPQWMKMARIELADEVIRAFGLTESYPDTSAEVVEYPLVRGHDDKRKARKVTRVTKGAEVFIDDVRTVAQSRDASEASKRLGIKGGDSGE